MRAVWYESGGPAAEVLQIGDLEAPQPGEGEVRVKIAYSSVHPFDIKAFTGARVIATASSEKCTGVESLGAELGAEVSLGEVATLHQRVEDGAVSGAALIRI